MNRRLAEVAELVALAALLAGCAVARPQGAASNRPLSVPVQAAETFAIPQADRPHDMAVDQFEHAVWVVSIQPIPGDRVFRLDTQKGTHTSWPIPGKGTWAGGAVCATRDALWIALGPDLVRFDKTTHGTRRYAMPKAARTVPSGLIRPAFGGRVPDFFGVTHIAVDGGGSVWLARPFVNSLLEFRTRTGTFVDHPLPASFGSPDELAVAATGSIWMSVSVSGDTDTTEPGIVTNDKLGLLDPVTGSVHVFPTPAASVHAVTGGVLFAGPQRALWRLDQASGEATKVPFPGLAGDFLAFVPLAGGRLFAEDASGVAEISAEGRVERRYTLPEKIEPPGHMMRIAGAAVTTPQAPPPRVIHVQSHVVALDTDAEGVGWALIENFSLIARIGP